jgi:hypothetical protein
MMGLRHTLAVTWFAIGFLVPPGIVAAHAGTVAASQAEDLNGRKLTVPADLGGTPSVWVIAFDREQQGQVDRLYGLYQAVQSAEPGMQFWEVPVIEDPGMMVRWFIDNGMRSGIPDTEVRARVVTLYVPDRKAWLQQVGIKSTAQAYLAVVGSNGEVKALAAQSDVKTSADLANFLKRAAS